MADPKQVSVINNLGESPKAAEFGAALREMRLAYNRSVADVAADLRIRQVYLEAIEEGRLDDLPGPAYSFGFVRAYATYLGLDVTEVVSRYRAATGNVVSSKQATLAPPSPVAEGGLPTGSVLLVAGVLAVIAYGGWYYLSIDGRNAGDVVAGLPQRLAALVGMRGEPEPVVQMTPAPAPKPTVAAPTASTAPTAQGSAEPVAESAAAADTAAPAGQEIAAQGDAAEAAVASAPAPTPMPTPNPEVQPEPAPMVEAQPEPQPAPVAEVQPEPAPEPVVEALPAPEPAPVAEALPEPAPEPVVEALPAPEPAPTAAPEPEPAPVAEAQPEPAPAPEPVAEAPPAPAPEPAPVAEAPPTPAPVAVTEVPPAPEPQPAPEPVVVSALLPPSEPPPAAMPVPTPADTAPPTQVAAAPVTPLPEASQVLLPRRVVLRATAPSWVEVNELPDREVFARLMYPGDIFEVPPRPGFTMSTGNAGGVQILINGELMPPLGPIGAVRRDVVLEAETLLRNARAAR